MPLSLLTHTMPGALVSLAAHLGNAARKAGDTEPPATSPSQPQGTGPAVRFDFSPSAATVPAGGTLPGAPGAAISAPPAAFGPATPETAAAAPAAASPLPAVPAPAAGPASAETPAPAPAVRPQPAGRAAAQGPGVGVPAPQAAGTTPAGLGARRPEPAGLDDEARARAWAIRTTARDNTLNMIGRIARLAEQPAPAKTAQDSAGQASPAAEPKTLARV